MITEQLEMNHLNQIKPAKKQFMKILLTLFICIVTFTSCSQSNDRDIDKKLADLEKEKLAFDKKVESIKIDSLRKSAEEFGGMLFWIQKADLENMRTPKDTSYQENPMAILEDYPTVQGLTENYLNGILIENNGDFSTKRQLKVIYPFEYPFQQNVVWTNVQFNNNTVNPIVAEYKEDSKAIQVVKSSYNNGNELDVYYPNQENNIAQQQPVLLNGSVETVSPKAILQFKFAHNETGDTKEQNGIKVKLVSIKGHIVSVEVTNPNKQDPALKDFKGDLVNIQATDKTKKFLSRSGASSGPDDLLDHYKSILNKIIDNPENVKSLEKDLEKSEAEYEKKHKNQSFYKTYYRGPVEDVIVYVSDYSKAVVVKRELKLPTYSFTNHSDSKTIAEIPSHATVYDRSLNNVLNQKSELSEKDLTKEIKIEQKAYTPPTKKGGYEGMAQFSFEYPKILSTLFLDDFSRYEKLKTVSFYDKKGGKQIVLPADSVSYHDGSGSVENPWVEFQVNRIEYNPSKFPVKPGYATGLIQIRLSDVKKIVNPVSKLPAGIKVVGNQLIIDGSAVEGNNKFYVKDKTGKYLKQITSIAYDGKSGYNNDRIQVNYYYGVPFTIEQYQQQDSKIVDHTFEVELTKKVNKSIEED